MVGNTTPLNRRAAEEGFTILSFLKELPYLGVRRLQSDGSKWQLLLVALAFFSRHLKGAAVSQRCGLRLLAATIEFVQVPQQVCVGGRGKRIASVESCSFIGSG